MKRDCKTEYHEFVRLKYRDISRISRKYNKMMSNNLTLKMNNLNLILHRKRSSPVNCLLR